MVTVAMDTLGREAVEPWIAKAEPTHPTLLDPAHVTGELLGFVNVPAAVWIDEDGMIVRPAHTPSLQRSELPEPTDDMPDAIRETLELVQQFRRTDPEIYRAALYNWVERGADSPWALDAGEGVSRSSERTPEQAEAAAHFEIGQWLQRQGRDEEAVPWFKRSHELHTDNWTYRRQAWSIADPMQNPTEVYGTTWPAELKRKGPEHYYVPFQDT